MPQDISSDDEDQHIVEALSTRNHVVESPDATDLEKAIKETIHHAKIEEGLLPNPRYMNLTADEERQLELDELLWFAVEHGEMGLARQSIEDGANVSSRNSAFHNQTALHCASQFGAGHPCMVELLVSHGADVNARNCYNNTALHEAAFWGYKETVCKLLELGADPMALNALGLTPLLNAEGNWAAVSRPCAALHELENASMHVWEHPTKGKWRHRLRDPDQRREVVDILKAAMGNRSYGRGVDPYCGGVDFPDQWDEWDEEAEHYNPLSRPREFKSSLPPFRNPLSDKPSTRPYFASDHIEKEIDADLDRLWKRDKWQYYELFPDESMSEDQDRAAADRSLEDSVDSGKDEGQLLTRFDAGGPDARDSDLDGIDEDEAALQLDDDGNDAEGAATTNPRDQSSDDGGR